MAVGGAIDVIRIRCTAIVTPKDEGAAPKVSASADPSSSMGTEAHGAFGIVSGLDRALVTKTSVSMVQWQGHYPPPDAAERFEKLHPGAFARMLAMAESAQQSQIASVEAVNDHIRKDARRGVVLGTVVTLSSMLGAGFCAFIGQPWVAAALLGVPVLSVARALIETSRSK